MIKPVSSGSEGSPYRPLAGQATQEKMRTSYNPKTQKFGPMGASQTEKIEHMERVEQQVDRFNVPTDCTSPTFLKKVAPPTNATATPIHSSTKGVKEFFLGNASLYSSFISSVTQAQRTL